MDLNTVTKVIPVATREDVARWEPGAAWLAGGTWVFSEPQAHIASLLDLTKANWEPLAVGEAGLSIAATCTFAQLFAYQPPPDLPALDLIAPACRALLGSFKIWNVATIGGNICLALPAAPMIAFTVALEGMGVIWMPDGGERRVSICDLVTGALQTSLLPGEVLRAIELPRAALKRRTAHRRASLTSLGRSAAFLIATRGADGFALTVTGSTRRPHRFAFPVVPSVEDLHAAIDAGISDADYHDDVHGAPAWRQRLTYLLSAELRDELADI